jgi:penicillin G amidase
MALWSFVLCVSFVLGVSATACTRRAGPPLPPLVAQVSGTLAVPGLSSPVRIVRDRSGVPHIYAGNRDDLFFAQGFVQAQDRLFQMDLWRRAGQGRLAEVLGPNFVARDLMTRRVQYRGDLDAEWASYGPDARAIGTAFVRGINAWVAFAQERPPELFVLAGWKPETWSADDLLNRADDFRARHDAEDEVFRARLVAAVGVARADALLAREQHLVVAPGLDMSVVNPAVTDGLRRVSAPPFFLGLAAPVRGTPATTGGETVSEPNPAGFPLESPSPRYFVHLIAPGWNVIGLTSPWRPGVADGHNDRVAWTPEPFPDAAPQPDTQDIYVEKLNPSNPHQVEDEGRWVDTTVVSETIRVKGRAKPSMFEHEFTRHGPIIALDQGRHLAFVVRWSGSEAGTAPELGALALDVTGSAAEFSAALSRWKAPVRLMVGGGSGYQTVALVPVRAGGAGTLPVPGWSRTYDWTGWKTLADLPHGPDANDYRLRVSRPSIERELLAAVRGKSERADVLLRDLIAAPSLRAQQAIVASLIAEDSQARLNDAGKALMFPHPLGVTLDARRRFNIGPVLGKRAGMRWLWFSPATDWDHSEGMNAPGQSESPDSTHFADLIRPFAADTPIRLPFSEAAVQANAEATLTLIRK